MSNSPHQGKKGSAKKTPPALPPRVDLNEKLQNSSSNKKEAFPDPFGGDVFDQKFNDNKVITEDGSSDWATSWPNSQKFLLGRKAKTFLILSVKTFSQTLTFLKSQVAQLLILLLQQNHPRDYFHQNLEKRKVNLMVEILLKMTLLQHFLQMILSVM